MKAMRTLFIVLARTVLALGCSAAAWGQASPPPLPTNSQDSGRSAEPPAKTRTPDLSAPRADRVNAESLEDGESSSKDSQIDLSPPADDDKAHPNSSSLLEDAGTSSTNPNVAEFHVWDPHKAAKDVEVGDFYFKRKNYKAAEDRYREALYFKDNDALATFRLAVCLEKLDRPDEAREKYEAYLKILPVGPEAPQVKKAIERLKATRAASKPANLSQ